MHMFINKDVKLGVIGCGKMASAILSGTVKNQYIDENNIYLYDIDENNVNFLTNKYHFKKDEIEKKLVDILNEQGVQIDIHRIDINEVIYAAYKNSVKTDTDKFIEKLTEKGIDVEVLGTYKSSSSRISVRCKNCGHIWSPQADTLLSGNSSCRKCGVVKNGKAHLKSHTAFVLEVNTINPTVEILGRYVKASERIHVKCRLCGHEWDPVANSLVRKNPSACPECGKKKMIKTDLKSILSSLSYINIFLQLCKNIILIK